METPCQRRPKWAGLGTALSRAHGRVAMRPAAQKGHALSDLWVSFIDFSVV